MSRFAAALARAEPPGGAAPRTPRGIFAKMKGMDGAGWLA
jgi:hypothetical protein